jgi:hypothetical protein
MTRFEYIIKRKQQFDRFYSYSDEGDSYYQEKKYLSILDIPILNDQIELNALLIERYRERKKYEASIRDKNSISLKEAYDEYVKNLPSSQKCLMNQLRKFGFFPFLLRIQNLDSGLFQEEVTVDEFLRYVIDPLETKKSINSIHSYDKNLQDEGYQITTGWDEKTKKNAFSQYNRFVQYLRGTKKNYLTKESEIKYRNSRVTSIPLSFEEIGGLFLVLERETSERDELLIKLFFYLGDICTRDSILEMRIEELDRYASCFSPNFYLRLKTFTQEERGLMFQSKNGKPIQISQIKSVLKKSAKSANIKKCISPETLMKSIYPIKRRFGVS